MNAVVNGRFLSRRLTGVERYGQELLHHLGDRLRVVRPEGHVNGIRGHAWEQIRLPRCLRDFEILWSPANTGPLGVTNQILTIHDLSPLEHPEWYQPAFSLWYRWLWPRLIPRVKQIITPSEHVRKKVMARFDLPAARVITIPAGVDPQLFQRRHVPKEKYVLFVGSLAPRKNIGGLLKAWTSIQNNFPDYALLIAGTHGPVFPSMSLPAPRERVRWLGYVSDNELPQLYSQASLFILPSFDEGFGLPALEAMACGAPVIASSAGALPEVLGPAAIFFDPNHVDDIALTLQRVLSDEPLRQHMQHAGLTRAAHYAWHTAAEKTWEVLQA